MQDNLRLGERTEDVRHLANIVAAMPVLQLDS